MLVISILSRIAGPTSDELYEVDVSIIDQQLCKQRYAPDPIEDEHLCAGELDGGKGVCRVRMSYALSMV